MEALDQHTALVVVDLQTGTLANPTVHPAGEILSRATLLVEAFRAAGRPVVLASVTGTPAGRTAYGAGARAYPAEFSALAIEAEPGDVVVQRSTWDAFAGTNLHAGLGALGVTQLVIVGVATSFGVESTARRAYDLGYSVAIVTDAITDLQKASHDNSVARVFPALGELATTPEVLALLAG